MRFRNTIALAKSSWRVLRSDKELILLPVFSGLATLIIAATFLVPIFTFDSVSKEKGLSGTSIALLVVLYFVSAYITIFFNAALVSAAHERLTGGDPTIGSALRGAAQRAGLILPWALLSATVSIILRAIEERAGWLGRILVGLIGLAWGVVTFLVLPVMVIEGVGVRQAMKKSANMLRSTWGENLGAQAGFWLLGFLLIIPAVVLVGLGAVTGSGFFLAIAVAVAVLWSVVGIVVLAALSGVYQTALYHFAADGQVPSGYFDRQVMMDAFASRQPRGF